MAVLIFSFLLGVDLLNEKRVVYRMHRFDYKRFERIALFAKENSNVVLEIDTCLGGCSG